MSSSLRHASQPHCRLSCAVVSVYVHVIECVLSLLSCYSVSHLAFGCGNNSGMADRSVWPAQ